MWQDNGFFLNKIFQEKVLGPRGNCGCPETARAELLFWTGRLGPVARGSTGPQAITIKKGQRIHPWRWIILFMVVWKKSSVRIQIFSLKIDFNIKFSVTNFNYLNRFRKRLIHHSGWMGVRKIHSSRNFRGLMFFNFHKRFSNCVSREI